MASTAVLKSVRAHPKLLSLQHVDDAFLLSCTGNAPMTPLGHDAHLFAAATVSPRDPAAKLAAAGAAAATAPAASSSSSSSSSLSPTCVKLQATPAAAFASHRACIPSSTSSDDASDEEIDEEIDGSARASAATSSSSATSVKSNTGRWTEAEHQLFLQGLETFPYRAWKKIATLIKTRTVVQIRTHAQKYYQKLEKEEARLKERQAQDRAALAVATSSSTSTSTGDGASPPLPLLLSTPSSPAAVHKKKMHVMRKRKCSLLDMDMDSNTLVLPSVPKRLAREHHLAAHMSPKQKQLSSLSGAKLLLGSNPMDARFVFSRSAKIHAGLQTSQPLPLDLADAAAEAMILEFAEDRVLADYSLDCVDQTLASFDNDELLQLTEEELEWFSTTSTESSSVSGDVLVEGAAGDVASAAGYGGIERDAAALDCESFAADLCLDDEDFVLDPEKFLSSYFAPNE